MQQRLNSPDVSMDAPVGGGDGEASTTRGSLIASDEQATDEVLAAEQIKSLFREHLDEFEKTLKDRDLEVYKLRILNEDPMTLQEIGEKYGVSRERARQIEARIVKKLREFVDSKGVIDIDVT